MYVRYAPSEGSAFGLFKSRENVEGSFIFEGEQHADDDPKGSSSFDSVSRLLFCVMKDENVW